MGEYSNNVGLISTWNQARYACRNHNEGKYLYDLVSVHDKDENEFLVSLMLQEDPYLGIKHYNFPWIGLYCPPTFHNQFYLTCCIHATTPGSWEDAKWIDGSPVNFKNWSPSTNDQQIPSEKKVLLTHRLRITSPSYVEFILYDNLEVFTYAYNFIPRLKHAYIFTTAPANGTMRLAMKNGDTYALVEITVIK